VGRGLDDHVIVETYGAEYRDLVDCRSLVGYYRELDDRKRCTA